MNLRESAALYMCNCYTITDYQYISKDARYGLCCCPHLTVRKLKHKLVDLITITQVA